MARDHEASIRRVTGGTHALRVDDEKFHLLRSRARGAVALFGTGRFILIKLFGADRLREMSPVAVS